MEKTREVQRGTKEIQSCEQEGYGPICEFFWRERKVYEKKGGTWQSSWGENRNTLDCSQIT